jgi:hypothetical protein
VFVNATGGTMPLSIPIILHLRSLLPAARSGKSSTDAGKFRDINELQFIAQIIWDSLLFTSTTTFLISWQGPDQIFYKAKAFGKEDLDAIPDKKKECFHIPSS